MTRGTVVRLLVPVYLTLIAAIPVALAVSILGSAPPAWRAAALLVAVPAACTAYVLTAGLLSRFTLAAIVPGKFPRDVAHEIYGPRRLYALCWTAIYYCSPVYHAVLAVPALKRLTFRLFGYRGTLDFQTYPDTWLRDLPLLSIGKGAYLSNKATVSPNMCLRNGKIIVRPIVIGAGTMIGHLTMIAPGVVVGPESEVGVGAAVGLDVFIGAGVLVEHIASLDHACSIGDRCIIGTRAYIGRKAVIAAGLRIAPGTVVPPYTAIETQEDADALAPPRASTSAEPRAALAGSMPRLALVARPAT